ncbi:MAG: helix-turn-helix transcriptional regulator [Prolixibacteraceae bacterium]|nr:helix-turn-helix transcriptional regulator [Prolixibacteraceae bacterium]
MEEMEGHDHFTVLENKKIGRNIALFRKLRDKKALEVSGHLGMSEAAYTKYERGESKITIEFIQKVSEFLHVDPLQIISVSPSNFLENIQNSSIAIQDNSTFQTVNDQQTQLMLKLMEKVIALLEKDK